MRRLQLFLLAGGLRLHHFCSARHHAFSIHEDMLAYPQFEVVFSESYISETDAQALLDTTGRRSPSSPTKSAEPSSPSDAPPTSSSPDSRPRKGTTPESTDPFEDDDFPLVSETYELLNVPPRRYLCAIPELAPPPAPNQTATELAKAEEAREVSRASAKGWQLMSGLDGQCLFYVSGWWSYSFCYGRDVVQFHAVPPTVKGGMPVRDPKSQEYVLGRAPLPGAAAAPPRGFKHNHQHQQHQGAGGGQAVLDGGQAYTPPPNTELAVKGDQRYLVERLDGGTICDLTGRPRTIEIQYHCTPGLNTDRVGWIKEVTTCTYLMMVQTPRLCEDLAFVPPKPIRAHPISCRPVLGSADEVAEWHDQKTNEARAVMLGESLPDSWRVARAPADTKKGHYAGLKIGGVVVGGYNILGSGADGTPGPKLTPPAPVRRIGSARGVAAGGPALIEVLAIARSKERGGGIESLTDEELRKLELDPAVVDALRREVQALAGDRGWKLEMVEEPGEIAEIRGVVTDGDDEDEMEEQGLGRISGGDSGSKGRAGTGTGKGQGQVKHQGGGAAPGAAAARDERRAAALKGERGRGAAAAGKDSIKRSGGKEDDDDDEKKRTTEGSEEKFFKEEL